VGAEVRDQRGIAEDSRDRFGFIMQLSGTRQITQLGRTRLIRSGDSAFVGTAEPYTIETTAYDRFETIALWIPSGFLHQRGIMGERFSLQRRVGGCNSHNFASGTLQLFAKEAWAFSRDEFFKSIRAVADLILLAISTPTDRLSSASAVRSANIARAKDVIRRRFAELDLNLTDIAQAARLTLNYLHKLFRDEGCTLYEYLKQERLRRAYELLELARVGAMTVTDVAFRCGFSDSTYFSRSFKQNFGMSPREVRQRS
jgi:AraC-like DNA-binding protein